MKKGLFVTVTVLMLSIGCCGQVFSVDGVVLLNKKKALAGKITPGDTRGYPITLTRPGSYKLSGNLTVPEGVNGIEIASDDVTIDLNGFRIAGGGAGVGIKISTDWQDRSSISNGTVSGFGTGIDLRNGEHNIVRDVRLTNISSFSIVTGGYSTIQRNNAQGLIQANCPSVITENITEGFITVVIPTTGEHCVRWNNRAINFTGAVTQ